MNDVQTKAAAEASTSTASTASTASTTPSASRDSLDSRSLVPRVDVMEDDSGITLLADMPGVPKDQLELKIDGDTLTIEGAVTALTPGGLEAVYAEVRVPRYRRAFTLSRELDPTRIQAQLKDGVLNLRLPKAEHAKPRRITVQAG